jgi:hypothetical protein
MRASAIGLSASVILGLAATVNADTANVGGLAAAPAPSANNALYVELGGNGGFYTVNYERFLRKDASVRVGLMYMSISASAGSGMDSSSAKVTWTSIPLMFQYLGVAAGSHALELGGGVNMMYMSGNASTFDATASASGVIPVGTATLGYRYSDPSGGFIFRAGYTPMFFVTTEVKEVFHWGGLSFGYRFQ